MIFYYKSNIFLQKNFKTVTYKEKIIKNTKQLG